MTRRTKTFVVAAVLSTAVLLCVPALAQPQQNGPLTYPEIKTALQTKLPNQVFRNRTQLLTFVLTQIKLRKVDQPLTSDREDDLRLAGATDELLQTIRTNSPPVPVEPVDLGELKGRAVNLVKPEYTREAIQAKTTGEVKLALELDDTGRVTAVTRLTVLPNGLTEAAIDAARKSTFRPASRDGKPFRGTGTITYNFRLNLLDVAATLGNANSFRDRRECKKAIAEYGRVLEVESKNVNALFGRGACHLVEGDYALAEADLSNAAKTDVRDSNIAFFLALTLDFKGETAAAAENYGKALKLRPELDSQPTFQCLYIDRRQMTVEQARSAANAIINACNQAHRGAAPEISTMVSYKRGIAYRMKGDHEKAINEFENLRRSHPQLAGVKRQLQSTYNNRSIEAYNKKNYKEAFDDISLAIHADPQGDATLYINRCAIYVQAWKKYREGIEDCSEAIRLGTRSATPYSLRGYAYEMINNRDGAINDYKKVLELDPRNQAARSSLNRLQSGRPSMKY